ncbi:MAG: extracellular solute-binding protein [Acidimicrobiia bacterium]|nr:extracellular solute-binding protein [Acidimicrobiia bacterium]
MNSKSHPRSLVLSAAIFCSALFLAAFASSKASGAGPGPLVVGGEEIADAVLWSQAQKEGGLVSYSVWVADPQKAVVEEFKKQTGLDVQLVLNPNASAMYQRVVSEAGARKVGGSVLLLTDLNLTQALADAGILVKHDVPSLKVLNKDAIKGNYYSVLRTPYVIAYNTKLLKAADAPKSWKDLLDPKWKNKIGLVHTSAGGSTIARDTWLRRTYGVEYMQKLAANTPTITNGAGQTTEEMARGQYPVSLNLPGVIGVAKASGAPVDFVFPEDGGIGFDAFIGLIKDAPNQAAGRVFLNWNLSKAGQDAWARAAGTYSVRDDAIAPLVAGKALPPLSAIKINLPDPADIRSIDLQKKWQTEWNQMFGFVP